jgi:hypothetical protein
MGLRYKKKPVNGDELSKLIIRLEVVMVQKLWYVKKPVQAFVRQKDR